MIRVIDENVFTLYEGLINREEILNFSASFEKPQNLSYLICKDRRIAGAMSVFDFIENRNYIPVIIRKKDDAYIPEVEGKEWKDQRNKNLFEPAGILFRKYGKTENSLIPILDEAGQCICLLQYLENRMFGEKLDGTIYDSFEDIYRTDLSFDPTLIERYDSFVFYEYNEYTAFIADYIRKNISNKIIIFLDKRAEFFLPVRKIFDEGLQNEDSVILSEEWKVMEHAADLGRIMYVSSDFENEYGTVKRYLTGVYSSLDVIKSLVWCSRFSGKEKDENRVLFLNQPVSGSGLVDIMKFTAEYCSLAEKRGMLPWVEYHDDQGLFTNDSRENLWNLFFEPISVSEEVLNKSRIYRADENKIRLVDWEMNPYIYEEDCKLWEQIKNEETENVLRKYVIPRKELIEECQSSLPKELKEQKAVLGVIARGTDYRKEALAARRTGNYVCNQEIEFLLAECRLRMEEGYDYLYLATEDSEYFSLFQETFEDRLLFHDQKRGKLKSGSDMLVSQLLRSDDPTGQVKQYCHILCALAHCDQIISSMECGAYLAGLSKLFY